MEAEPKFGLNFNETLLLRTATSTKRHYFRPKKKKARIFILEFLYFCESNIATSTNLLCRLYVKVTRYQIKSNQIHRVFPFLIRYIVLFKDLFWII